MRNWALLGMMAVVGSALGQGISVKGDKGPGVDIRYDGYYNANHEVSIVGTVTGKIKGTPGNGVPESMSLLVRDKKNKIHQVDLGPAWFIRDQAAKINMGSRVKIVGSPITINGNEHVVLAREVMKGHQILSLRTSTGDPYWLAFHQGQVTVSGSNNSLTGKIVGQGTVNAENQQEVSYKVQTDNGLVNVAVAPNWYLEQQGLGFHVGDNVTVYTGLGAASYGNNVVLANGLYGSGGTLVLRPNGVPAWYGWNNYTGSSW